MSWNDDDPDAPQPRRWGGTDPFEIPRAFRHGAGARTDERPSTPLADLHDPLPPPAHPQRVPASAPPAAKPKLEVVVLTDDGVPLASVNLCAYDELGRVYDLTTDSDGRASVDVEVASPHSIGLKMNSGIDLSKVARSTEPTEIPASALRLDPNDRIAYRVGISGSVVIVIVRPKAVIISLDGWREGQAVMVFGAARTTPDGPATVRGILRIALAAAGTHRLFVVGHADTKGGAADNAELAADRATSVALYLSGDREAWAQHAYDTANMTTLKAALAWAAVTFGIDCDPGPVVPGWNAATAKALDGLRRSEGLDTDAKYGPDDWAAIYRLFDADLAAILYTDTEGLTALKWNLRLSDDDCGERWPTDAPAKDGHASSENRRVDLVISPEPPRASIDEIYDGTFACTHLPVPTEAKVRLRTVTTTLAAVGSMRVSLQIGPVRAELTADELGLVEFTALRGEVVTVLACTDLWSASRLVWGAYADMAPLGAERDDR